MSTTAHNAIVVTGLYATRTLRRAREHAMRLELHPTEITTFGMNGVQSFLIPPDGSYEGRDVSDGFDRNRDEMVRWLRAYGTGLDWVEVCYGDESGNSPGGARIVRHVGEVWPGAGKAGVAF